MSRMVRVDGVSACPFCGGSEIYAEEYEHRPGATRWRVLCAGCMAGIDTGTRQSAGSAVQDWNRRAPHPVVAEVKVEGEKLDEAVHRAITEYTWIDRDALLELADEIELDGAGALDDDDWCKGLLVEYARRIREALGLGERDAQ